MLAVEEQIRLIAEAAMVALDLDTGAERRATPGETVLDQMPGADTWSPVQFTEEVVTMVDVKTSDPTELRQKRPTRVVVAGLLAAAAVLAVAFVVIRDADDMTPADEPSTTVPPTPLPRALPETDGELLEPGTYYVDEVDGTPTARIYFTIGAGVWHGSQGGVINASGRMMFSRADRVFSDACHWKDGYHGPGLTTLDGFVAGLSEQFGWADVTTPSDISIDGYAGKAFQRTAPAELSDCDTMPVNWSPHIRPPNWGVSPLPTLQSWQHGGGDFGSAGELYEPGEVETLLLLDIDSTAQLIADEFVVINTRLWPSVTQDYRAMAGPSAAALAEFAAVLDSIRIDRG